MGGQFKWGWMPIDENGDTDAAGGWWPLCRHGQRYDQHRRSRQVRTRPDPNKTIVPGSGIGS